MQVPQATLLESLTLANKDSSAKLPSQWGCGSQTKAALPSALTECARCQLQPSAPPCTESSMHRCHCVLCAPCTEAAHKHTDMQASSTSNEAVLGLQHSALSHTPDRYCSQKNTGPSQQPCSHRSTEMETCFPNSSPNSKHVSSHKPGYEQGHSFKPLKFPLLPNKSYTCAVSPLHLCLPAPLVPGCSTSTRSADAQHLQPFHRQTNAKLLAMTEK